MKNSTFLGYRRKNKRVGTRNHVVILPVDDISNAACEAVANIVKGTLALPHAYGRLQFGEDLELFFRTMIGTGSNPNVAAVVVIGIEPGWTKRIVDGIAKTAGATASFGETSELTGGEDIVRAKAATPKVAEEFMAVWQAYTDMIMKEKTDDLSESQPTKGNIRGGLSTIEEKAMGNIEKLGRRTKFVGCLKPAEAPNKKGLWFMDTSSAAAEAVTLWAASGAVVHLFPTGQGNIIGNPIEPVIKLSANPITCRTMSEHIDLDVSAILMGKMSIEKAGEKLLALTLRTASGRLTAAEALGHREFVMTKLYRSA